MSAATARKKFIIEVKALESYGMLVETPYSQNQRICRLESNYRD